MNLCINLPEVGYIRQAELIGVRPVTPEQAQANRQLERRVVRPRHGKSGLLPWSSATLWRKVKSGDFPAPVKLSEGITAWPVESVRAWMQSKNAA